MGTETKGVMPLRIGGRRNSEHYHGVLGAVGVVSTPGAWSLCESFNCLPYRFSEGFASFGKLSKSVRLLSAFKGVSARWRCALARLCEQIAPLSRSG